MILLILFFHENTSIKNLRNITQNCNKGPQHDTWVARRFTRKISIYFTYIFINLKLSANQITFIWGILGLVGVYLFSFGHYKINIIASVLIILSNILDHSDGEVARYNHKCSFLGIFLDRLFHNLIYPSIFISMSFGLFALYHDIRIFLVGFLISFAYMLTILNQLERMRINYENKISQNYHYSGSHSIFDIINLDVILYILLVSSILDILLIFNFICLIGLVIRLVLQLKSIVKEIK